MLYLGGNSIVVTLMLFFCSSGQSGLHGQHIHGGGGDLCIRAHGVSSDRDAGGGLLGGRENGNISTTAHRTLGIVCVCMYVCSGSMA